MKARNTFATHTRMAGRWLLTLALPALLALGGCVRMDVLPTSDEGVAMPLSEPRPYDEARIERQKDPTKVYRIGPRDKVRVDVRQDETLAGIYEVTAEGNVLLPNVGSVHIADLTADESVQTLTEILSKYIRNPEVKVGVQDYLSKVVYVVGQVASPGPVNMRADMLTLEEAIFAAGLPTPEAAMQRTLVVRPDEIKPIVYEVDLTDIIYKGKLRENILLRPNDRVYVPSRYSTNLRAAIRELLGPVEDVQRARSRVLFSGNDGSNYNSGY